MNEINGAAHFVLTVSQFDAAKDFYCELLPIFGLQTVYEGNNFIYHVGGRTAVGIQRCAPEYEGERFMQNRVGLHHACLRTRSREDVDAVAKKLKEMGAFIHRGPMELDNSAPGYYYIVFEDPDGIRLEVNYVPGKGLLTGDEPTILNNDSDWNQDHP